MKTKHFLISLSFAMIGLIALAINTDDDKELPSLEIGAKPPKAEVKMQAIDGSKLSLKDVAKSNGLLVVFSCNTCPFVLGWEDRYNEILQHCNRHNIGMVLVNSNEAKRTGDDSMEKMKEHAKEKGYECNYVIDKNHVVADAFGAKTTPHVFLFDGNMKLQYKGAIDDNMKDRNAVKSHYLKEAIEQMMAGVPPSPAETKAVGCSIKRVKASK